MGKKTFAALTLTVIVAFTSGGWLAQDRSPRVTAYDKARLFDDIIAHVATYYVDSLTEPELYDLAIDGMLGQLNDPYTNFLREQDYSNLSLSTTGDYAGIGIQIDSRDSWITIVSTFSDTPGERAGLSPGDLIVEIEGESTHGWTPRQASTRLKGPPDTEVSITVRRPGLDTPLHFEITRAAIHVSSVEGQMILGDDVGYMRLTNVTDVAATELASEISAIRGRGARSLILDLRGNPGGILTQGVALADLFLDSGLTVVDTRGRAPGATETYRARHEAVFSDLPLVLLVDGFTASAAEILSGALQDHDRAAIIGTETFGKGVAYLVFRVSETEALSVTSSRWYTPVGRSIDRPRGNRHPLLAERAAEAEADSVFYSMSGRELPGGAGIQPDIMVPDTLTDEEQAFGRALGSKVPAYRDVLTRYARELRGQNNIDEVDFPVTPRMRSEILSRLRAEGIEITDRQWMGAEDFVARQFGLELARYVFGRSGELERRAQDDPQIAAALELLNEASSVAELMTLASAR